MKPISFKDVGPTIPEAMAEVMDDLGLPEDYLTQTVDVSFEQRAGQPVVKPKRFGHGSTAEGPDEVNL